VPPVDKIGNDNGGVEQNSPVTRQMLIGAQNAFNKGLLRKMKNILHPK
jgi:hypothetical protein